MKGKQFENQREIYQALLDGKKIRFRFWASTGYLLLKDGLTYRECGSTDCHSFSCPDDWELYEEPKQHEKWYRCLVRSIMGEAMYFAYRKYTTGDHIVKVYDDYILVDENGKLVEESK